MPTDYFNPLNYAVVFQIFMYFVHYLKLNKIRIATERTFNEPRETDFIFK